MLYIYIWSVCALIQVPVKTRRGCWFIGTKLRGGCEPFSHECWKQKLGHFLEKYNLLVKISVAPSVQILIYFRWIRQIYFVHTIIWIKEIIYFLFDSRNLSVSMGSDRKSYIEWQVFMWICLYIFAYLVT